MNDAAKIAAFCRQNLINFSRRLWPGYRVNWHHRLIAAHLEAVERGEIRNLVITQPPRHGKSMQVSEFFPAWCLGRRPDRSVIFATYGQSLANRFGRKVRAHLLNQKFLHIFPEAKMSMDSKAKHALTMNAGGEYHAVGRGGAFTGKGASIMIFDDMVKDDKEAASPAVRAGFEDWFESTATTRLEPDGAMIFMGTRWHEDDPIGRVLDQHAARGWIVLDLPALLEKPQPYDQRAPGDALWPDRWPREKLEKVREEMTPYFWNAIYQQRPSPPSGNIIKREWFRYYDDLPKKIDRWGQSWDLAFGKSDGGSFVVGQLWAVSGSSAYLVRQFRERCDFPASIAAFEEMWRSNPKAFRKLIERKANGQALIDMLKNKIPGIVGVDVCTDKVARANAATPILQAGNVLLPRPEREPWVYDFVEECVTFPRGENDDQVDAMTQFLIDAFGESDYKRFLTM